MVLIIITTILVQLKGLFAQVEGSNAPPTKTPPTYTPAYSHIQNIAGNKPNKPVVIYLPFFHQPTRLGAAHIPFKINTIISKTSGQRGHKTVLFAITSIN